MQTYLSLLQLQFKFISNLGICLRHTKCTGSRQNFSKYQNFICYGNCGKLQYQMSWKMWPVDFTWPQPRVVEVKTKELLCTSLYAMSCTVWSTGSTSVVRSNAWMQLYNTIRHLQHTRVYPLWLVAQQLTCFTATMLDWFTFWLLGKIDCSNFKMTSSHHFTGSINDLFLKRFKGET